MTLCLALLTISVAAPGSPSLPPVGEISAPLGHIGNVVDAFPKRGVSDSDKVVTPSWAGCEARGVYLMRFLGGASRAVEQLQQSLDRVSGSEKSLFGRKGVLAEVMKQLSASRFEPKVACAPSPLAEGYKLQLAVAPQKWCEAGSEATSDGEFWFFANGRPAAVISVQKGGVDSCLPRLSTVLFDAKGVGRVRLHADWGGAMSASLAGERCRLIDYTLDPSRQVFVPAWKSCKR